MSSINTDPLCDYLKQVIEELDVLAQRIVDDDFGENKEKEGGSSTQVQVQEKPRYTQQAERDLYRPQPQVQVRPPEEKRPLYRPQPYETLQQPNMADLVQNLFLTIQQAYILVRTANVTLNYNAAVNQLNYVVLPVFVDFAEKTTNSVGGGGSKKRNKHKQGGGFFKKLIFLCVNLSHFFREPSKSGKEKCDEMLEMLQKRIHSEAHNETHNNLFNLNERIHNSNIEYLQELERNIRQLEAHANKLVEDLEKTYPTISPTIVKILNNFCTSQFRKVLHSMQGDRIPSTPTNNQSIYKIGNITALIRFHAYLIFLANLTFEVCHTFNESKRSQELQGVARILSHDESLFCIKVEYEYQAIQELKRKCKLEFAIMVDRESTSLPKKLVTLVIRNDTSKKKAWKVKKYIASFLDINFLFPQYDIEITNVNVEFIPRVQVPHKQDIVMVGSLLANTFDNFFSVRVPERLKDAHTQHAEKFEYHHDRYKSVFFSLVKPAFLEEAAPPQKVPGEIGDALHNAPIINEYELETLKDNPFFLGGILSKLMM